MLELGRVVFNFNHLESKLRSLLWVVSSNDELKTSHDVIASILGNKGICEALRTITNERCEKGELSNDVRDHIEHIVELFERTREYRNWYVHGMQLITTKGMGLLYETRSAKYLYETTVYITPQQLCWFADWCHTANNYVANCFVHIARKLELRNVHDPLRPLPKKLPLPDRLKKPRQRRQYATPPPPPSEG